MEFNIGKYKLNFEAAKKLLRERTMAVREASRASNKVYILKRKL
jgi:hypothetical protein